MVAPYSESRLKAREIIGEGFIEVYLDVSLQVCEKRDVKGMYKRARNGEIKNFTGISDVYEEPINPDISIRTDILDVEDCVKEIEGFLARRFLMPIGLV
jgi:adenylylsulfate kinase-like enzyme